MGSSESINDQQAAGQPRLSRRTFIRVSLAGAAVLAVPGAIAVARRSGSDGVSSFDMSFDESVQVVFSFGARLGSYDIAVRQNGLEVERFEGVAALAVARLKSEYVTVTRVAPPVAA
jgi:hypothetical protein